MKISKKLAVLAVTSALILFEDSLGIQVDEQTRTNLVMLAAAYLAGQGLADFGKHRSEK